MEAWAYIIKNKLYRNLQGFYGRISSELINNGYISIDGKINWDKVYNSE